MIDIIKSMIKSSRNRLTPETGCVIPFEKVVAALKKDRMDGRPVTNNPLIFEPRDGVGMNVAKAPASMRAAYPLNKGTSTMYVRQWNRADWTGVDPLIQLFSGLLIGAARKQDIPLYVHCALRTPSEQLRLYTLRRSKVRGPKAAHTTGCAVDIVHGDNHWDLTPSQWQWVGVTGKQIAERYRIPIIWGGDWGWDMAHWELNFWEDKQPVTPDLSHQPLHMTPTVLLHNNKYLIK
jgi:hypothetical protein